VIFDGKKPRGGRASLLLTALILCGLGGLIGACAEVPKHMQVDSGLNPKNQDKEVRFRTTYYFRVFDYCADKSNGGIETPFAIDSLYRFRMTGKANSLTTRVNFESGTLTAGQIDPFGATVKFDKKNGQFYFKTQEQVQQEAARERQFEELDRLVEEYRKMADMLSRKPVKGLNPDEAQLLENIFTVLEEMITQMEGTPDGASASLKLNQLKADVNEIKNKLASEPEASLSVEDQRLLTSFRTTIDNQIALIRGVSGGPPPIEESIRQLEKYQGLKEELEKKSSEPLSDEEQKKLKFLQQLVEGIKKQIISNIKPTTPPLTTSAENGYCQNPRRGFQILGPEGWRTFNQDERLIMAMNATGEPLIATMQELAGRVLDNQPIEAELLLPLMEEDLRITRTERELDHFSRDKPEQIVDILEKAIKAFTGKEATE
jgi:hypothetical protein